LERGIEVGLADYRQNDHSGNNGNLVNSSVQRIGRLDIHYPSTKSEDDSNFIFSTHLNGPYEGHAKRNEESLG
jgi:hypothetical protein